MIWKLLACIFMTVTAAFIVTVIMDIRKKNKTKLDFKNDFDNLGLPIITLKVVEKDNIKDYNFIVDTGSTINIIDSNILENLDYEPLDINTEILGVDGAVGKSTGCILKIIANQERYKCDFISRDMSASFGYIKEEKGIDIHGLLGSTFLNEFKYKIDFSKYQLYK